MLEARIIFDPAELTKTLNALADKLPRAVAAAVRWTTEVMIRDVVLNRLSGQYLRVVTGTARRSVQGTGSVEIGEDRVTGTFGSPEVYVRAHEFGFHGIEHVRAHTRRLVAVSYRRGAITKKSAAALAKAQATGRKTTTFVRAHDRQANMRARHFFRDTIREKEGLLPVQVRAAVLALARTGNIPTVGELGGA